MTLQLGLPARLFGNAASRTRAIALRFGKARRPCAKWYLEPGDSRAILWAIRLRRTPLLPDSKCHCPGDTCLLILRLTLPYHTSMARSGHSPVNRESPLSLGEGPGVRGSHRLGLSRWPKTAQNGPEWPACPTPFLFGERPIFGPPGSSAPCVSPTKRSRMVQNGANTKKLP